MANNPSEYGDDSFTEERIQASGLLEDIKALGPNIGEDALALIAEVVGKGKPYDDRTMVMEKVMKLTASLPPNSKMRKKLSDTIITTMWSTLQHPPQSYYGDEYQYRAADGSNNNVMIPKLGAAGMPYAKSVRSVKALHGAKPDPGLLFDLLMARPDGKFRDNKAGINSILFYHATVIIHDLFRTNRKDSRVSDTSSYLDLSPLYGKDQKAQDTVRTGEDGKLKPDTFAEERLLGQPPGTCVMLVMYNRYHNYIAENLAAINDCGRFTMPREDAKDPEAYQTALKKRDNDLFQTARLVLCGLYMNITLHDYIRGITNVHHSQSTWTIEPRVDILNDDGSVAVERGVGNQVSSEFNLLYRFHSAISERDAKWTEQFMKQIFGDKDPTKLSIPEFVQGALAFEASHPKDPSNREFGGLKRDPTTGKFDDAAMVQILKESIEDPAGAFGARNIPKLLRTVEILGILQARKWHSASLNEFRRFFGLKEHTTFEEMNPDPEIADLLAKLYDSPDMVEMYPGLFIEDIKKRMDPGSGIGIPYTAGRAVLSDAVGFIRGDRFFTVDYTSSNLTPWGMAEVQQDYLTLGGSVMYRLFTRGFPRYFKFNSVYVMQPMYLPSMNIEIFKEFKTIDLYSTDPPSVPPKITVVSTQASISTCTTDAKNFGVSHSGKLKDSASADFLVCTDFAAYQANHSKLAARVANAPGGLGLFAKTIESTMRNVLARESYKLVNTYQVDMSKDIGRVVMIQTVSELFHLPLATKANGNKGLSESKLYKNLENYINYCLIDADPAESWRLRRNAQASYEELKTSTEEIVHGTGRIGKFLSNLLSVTAAPAGSLKEVGQKYTKDLLDGGYSETKVATTLYSHAAGLVAPISSLFAQIMEWFLLPSNASYWAKVRELATQNTPAAYESLKKYVLEASRFQYTFPTTRVCQSDCSVVNDQGQSVSVKKGEIILANHTGLLQDSKVFSSPDEFNPSRPLESYQVLAWAPKNCVGRDIVIVSLTSMVKVAATIKGLRSAPDTQGQIKYTRGPLGSKQFLSDDWKVYQPFAGAWKVHFDELAV